MTDKAAAAEGNVDSSYYHQGERWETSVYRSVAVSRGAWRGIALVLGCCLIAALIALVLLIPLKSFEVVTLAVDKTTGFVEVMRPLADAGDLTQNESVTRANIVRFLRARETYDPRGLRDNYELAGLFSGGVAREALEKDFSGANLENMMHTYGPNTQIRVIVKSVIFLNERTAAVRFQTIREAEHQDAVAVDWVANVRYRYTSQPMRTDWRFDNPLGFQVMEYRRDQETAGAQAETKP